MVAYGIGVLPPVLPWPRRLNGVCGALAEATYALISQGGILTGFERAQVMQLC